MARRKATAVVEDEVFEDVDELEELEDPDDDLEELEEEDEPEPAPAAKRGRKATKAAPAPKAEAPIRAAKAATAGTKRQPVAASEASEFDSNWLASHVSETTDVAYDGRGIRMLLRKLAKDGTLNREIGTDRGRYVFPKGENDPIVRAVIKMVKSGEGASIKREGLETVKATNAAKRAAAAPAKAAPAKATKATKAAPTKAAAAGRRRRPAAE